MISRRLRKQFTILKNVGGLKDGGGTPMVSYVPQEPLWAVVTNVGTSDNELANSDVLSRQKRIRAFEEVDVKYNDKIKYNGETWRIVGQPETVRSPGSRRKLSTVIIIEKEGTDASR